MLGLPGRPGLEGPRGEPALLALNSTKTIKGDKGDRGDMGRIGPKGIQMLIQYRYLFLKKNDLTYFSWYFLGNDGFRGPPGYPGIKGRTKY